jgi:glyoxylase-like metal-dependent hydrolase (beta-lactamase superfamily II)
VIIGKEKKFANDYKDRIIAIIGRKGVCGSGRRGARSPKHPPLLIEKLPKKLNLEYFEMEISADIHRITCPFGDRLVYCYLVIGEERTVLVDTGMAFSPEQDIFPYMERLGLKPGDLDLVFITHSDVDHQGGNDMVREAAPQAQFACHTLDAAWIESAQALIEGRYSQFESRHAIGYGEQGKADIARDCQSHTTMDWHLQGGERYRIGSDRYLSFIYTPGHTWGHTAVLDEQSSTLIAGEASLHKAILGLNGQPALPPTYCYIPNYEATLQRLISMQIDVYAAAHWPVQRGQAVKTFLSESLSYLRESEQKVLELLADAPVALTLKEIIGALNDNLGTWPKSVSQDLAYGLSGHLAYLRDRGLVLETTREGLAAYQAVEN